MTKKKKKPKDFKSMTCGFLKMTLYSFEFHLFPKGLFLKALWPPLHPSFHHRHEPTVPSYIHAVRLRDFAQSCFLFDSPLSSLPWSFNSLITSKLFWFAWFLTLRMNVKSTKCMILCLVSDSPNECEVNQMHDFEVAPLLQTSWEV